jgi:hypothetical protein
MTFFFPRSPWLWGWQLHATYICFHLGKVDVMVTWRP